MVLIKMLYIEHTFSMDMNGLSVCPRPAHGSSMASAIEEEDERGKMNVAISSLSTSS